MPALGKAYDAALVFGVKLAVSLGLIGLGFSAISDDDYARSVIAQSFAESPKLDPSGTSWLPFPFWLYGLGFKLFGSEPVVARVIAVLLGIAAALLVWAAARILGASRLGAALGALLAAIFPYSAYLGAAVTPEAPTAALTLFAAATLVSESAKLRAAGAVACFVACFSRYEAWPVGLVFAGLSFWDALRFGGRAWLASAALALAAPALWVLHGVFVHHDALFFVTRVTAYRHALGGQTESLIAALLRYPLLLLRAEPEIALLTLAALGFMLACQTHARRYLRPSCCALAVMLFLAVGEARGGGATHHVERALLALWFGLCVFSADVLERGLRSLTQNRRLGAAVGLFALAVGSVGPRSLVFEREAFADREEELRLGRTARDLGARGITIATNDFGYFAVMYGFGTPSRTKVLDNIGSEASGSPLATLLASDSRSIRHLAPIAGAEGWMVAPARARDALSSIGSVRASGSRLLLVQVRPQP